MAFGARPFGTRTFGDATVGAVAPAGPSVTWNVAAAHTIDGEFIAQARRAFGVAAAHTIDGEFIAEARKVLAVAAAHLLDGEFVINMATQQIITLPIIGNQPTLFSPRVLQYYPNFGDFPNEVQVLTVTGTGLISFTLTFDGFTTTSLPANATSVAVAAALEALPSIGYGNVSVTGDPGGPWTVTFINDLGHQDVPEITTTPTGGTGGVDVDTTVPGVDPPPWWTPEAVPLGPTWDAGITVEQVTILPGASIPVTGAPLTGTWDKNWQDQLLTDGSGGLSLDETTAVEGETVLRFSLEGATAFQVLVNQIEHIIAAEGEEHDQIYNLSGPGAIALLANASIAPEAGFPVDQYERRTSKGHISDIRYFNYSSQHFDDALWNPAVATAPEYDTLNLYGRPVGMKDATGSGAQWLWDRHSAENVPGGDVYFRQWFDDGRGPNDPALVVRVEAAADDELELWIDNVPVLEIKGVYAGGMKWIAFDLEPGTHLVAWRGRNRNALRAGTIWSIGTMTSRGFFDDVIAHSDSADAVCLGYPSAPPGFTVGQAFRQLLLEAQGGTRIEIPYLTTSFGSFYDSDGTPWPIRSDLSCRIDASLLDAVRSWGESQWEVAMASYGFEFHAWIKGQRGTDVNATWDLGDEIVSLTSVKTATPNVAIVRYDGGRVEVKHANADTQDRRVVNLNMGHIKSATQARREGIAYLDAAVRRSETKTLELDVVGLDDQVYTGAWVGDSPLTNGERLRIHGITVTENEDEYTVVPEVISAALTAEERSWYQSKQMNPGAATGTSRAVSPAADIQFPEGRDGQEYVLPFSWENQTNSIVYLYIMDTDGVTPILVASLNPVAGDGDRTVIDPPVEITDQTQVFIQVGSSPSQQKRSDQGIWLMEFRVDRDPDPARGTAEVLIA